MKKGKNENKNKNSQFPLLLNESPPLPMPDDVTKADVPAQQLLYPAVDQVEEPRQ